MPMYRGNEPTNGILIGQTSHFKIWQIANHLTSEWRSLKITAIEPMERKANYYTAYSLAQKRFANSKCWQTMKKHKAKKHANEITLIVQKYFAKD